MALRPKTLSPAEKASAAELREFVEEGDWKGLKVETTLERGHPGEQVCRRAGELGADLIVTSTHGRTGLKRVLPGSMAEYIVRHAACPVLVVPSCDFSIGCSCGEGFGRVEGVNTSKLENPTAT